MTPHNSFLIEMNRFEPGILIDQNDTLETVSNPSSKKSNPNQVKNKVESILTVQKRQYSREDDKDSKHVSLQMR